MKLFAIWAAAGIALAGPAWTQAVLAALPTSRGASVLLEDAERIVTIAAIVCTGVWAYFNFVQGRIHRPRLELGVEGEFGTVNAARALVATVRLKNVGFSKVMLTDEGTALQIFSTQVSSDFDAAQPVDWEYLILLEILGSHQWIEPGESIVEQYLIAVPGSGHFAFRFEARIVSAAPTDDDWSPFSARGSTEWNASTICVADTTARTTSTVSPQ